MKYYSLVLTLTLILQLLSIAHRDREESSQTGKRNGGRWVWGPDRRCKETPGTGTSEG